MNPFAYSHPRALGLARSPHHAWLVAIVALLAMQGTGTRAACSSRDIDNMRRSGMNSAMIHQLCNPGPARGGPGRPTVPATVVTSRAAEQTNICQAGQQLCSLQQQGTPGQTCWCNTKSGPMRGVLVRR
jgi:hypothetical protein